MKPINCPNCGQEIQYDDSHKAYWDPDIIACTCHTGRSMTIVAVEYKDNWYSPNYFLTEAERNGVYLIDNQRDERTFEVLRYYAMYDAVGFTSQPYHHVRILWVDGEAIGFYTDNEYFGNRGIGHIFVRREYRRKSFATKMIQDFLSKYPGETVYILSPNEMMYTVLEKMGLVEKKGHNWIFIDRMDYMPSV